MLSGPERSLRAVIGCVLRDKIRPDWMLRTYKEDTMELTKLRSQIHALPRREKYLLIQLLVLDLAREDSLQTDGRSEDQSDGIMEMPNGQAVGTFLGRWKGCLKGVDPDEAKQSYLREKYQ
ncbi:MAG: hypothetical protein SD837_04075 [Candidatus Electrothrix scaldis]|nr:MAG: hypothetical protein SD837_04075 [Candidatus Electrothrix sp. GW3-3]